ncbi:MAG: biopolymer transporter ExbD [Bdellovibrionales bacterium]|nr:biopolymer transporter ExbD [Bdellovibrionales bacterium]
MMTLQQQLEMLEYKRFKDRKMGKRRHKYFDDAAGAQELNLVAMMDMLTILLVFLLKSYSVSAMSIPVGEDKLSVPISTNNINPKEAVKLTVTKIGKDAAVIAVDETVVVTLTDAKLSELKGQSRKRQYMIKDLNTALLQKAGAIKEMAKINPNIVFDHKIMVIADKDTPYWLVTSVLYTSAEAGFDQYNLVALRKDQ